MDKASTSKVPGLGYGRKAETPGTVGTSTSAHLFLSSRLVMLDVFVEVPDAISIPCEGLSPD